MLFYFCHLKLNLMKHFLIAIALLGLIGCQEQKIGYVDSVKLMEGYQEKKDIEAKYKLRTDSLTKKRDSISQAFQAEAQAFQSEAQKMSQQKAQEEYGKLQQRGQQIGQQLQMAEQQMQMEGQTEMDSLVNKVRKVVREYGEDNGYTFILGGGDGGSVLYGEESKDLTEEILKVLNDSYEK